MSKFTDRIKEGIGIVKPVKSLNPSLNTSPNKEVEVRHRNARVRKAQKELGAAKKSYQLWQSMKGANFTTRGKAPELYKYEQAFEKAKKDNPSINVGQSKIGFKDFRSIKKTTKEIKRLK